MEEQTHQSGVVETPAPSPAASGRSPAMTAIRDVGILGRSRLMRDVYRQIEQAASADMPVLITGETGTGKDLVAQAIHALSKRAEGPYVPIHLGALPDQLLASELFGHERGAFTGALEKRKGKFELAHGGTVFLDEISTVDAQVQVSLLRILEQKRFTRLGGKRTVHADARIVAASNEDLQELAAAGQFRQDLLYRLDAMRITLPALRDRHGDIPLLVRAFLRQHAKTLKKKPRKVTPDCLVALQSYPWPGNVRELKNVVQRALLVSSGKTLDVEHLPERFQDSEQMTDSVRFRVGTPLHQMEREMIVRTLAVAQSRTHAAALLGISRRALYNKLERYGLL